MQQVIFGSYVFPHNPRKIQLEARRQTASHVLPFLGEQLVITGSQARVALLEGELFADTREQAEELCQALCQVYETGERGLLILPGVQPFPAWFESLKLLEAGDGRVYTYTAGFVEDLGYGGEEAV